MIRKKWIRIELWTGHSGLYSDNFSSEINYREMNNSAKKKFTWFLLFNLLLLNQSLFRDATNIMCSLSFLGVWLFFFYASEKRSCNRKGLVPYPADKNKKGIGAVHRPLSLEELSLFQSIQ